MKKRTKIILIILFVIFLSILSILIICLLYKNKCNFIHLLPKKPIMALPPLPSPITGYYVWTWTTKIPIKGGDTNDIGITFTGWRPSRDTELFTAAKPRRTNASLNFLSIGGGRSRPSKPSNPFGTQNGAWGPNDCKLVNIAFCTKVKNLGYNGICFDIEFADCSTTGDPNNCSPEWSPQKYNDWCCGDTHTYLNPPSAENFADMFKLVKSQGLYVMVVLGWFGDSTWGGFGGTKDTPTLRKLSLGWTQDSNIDILSPILFGGPDCNGDPWNENNDTVGFTNQDIIHAYNNAIPIIAPTINYPATTTNLKYITTALTSSNGYFQYCCCPSGTAEATSCESNEYNYICKNP